MPGDCVARPDPAHDRETVSLELASKIGAQSSLRIAAIGTLEEKVRAEVDRVVIVRRDEHRGAPVPPIRLATKVRQRFDGLLLAGAYIVADDVAALRFTVNRVRVNRIYLSVESVAAGGANPVGVGNALAIARLARCAPAAVVLQPAVHVVVRLAHVGGDRVV